MFVRAVSPGKYMVVFLFFSIHSTLVDFYIGDDFAAEWELCEKKFPKIHKTKIKCENSNEIMLNSPEIWKGAAIH